MNCRHCRKPLEHVFIDLGYAPPSNAYLSEEELSHPEVFFPLKTKVCNECWLVQTEDFTDAETLFTSKYAYFSSTSSSFLLHAENYTNKIIQDCNLDEKSFVIEVASNDGYLLKNFIKRNIPCLGVEPTISTAEAAKKLNIPVIREFFSQSLGKKLANENKQADLIIGNNVYAHVPDINDFTRGLKAALKFGGTITLEFPHLMRLIEKSQFDTIYHEHFSYLSLYTVNKIFSSFGLRIWHVEEISIHGGSLRVYGCHHDDKRDNKDSVEKVLKNELTEGLKKIETYNDFSDKANKIKDDLVSFLIEQKKLGYSTLAYGAAAKGITLLNYAGIKQDLLPFVFDAAKSKQGQFLPGSHIPILPPEKLENLNPDFLLILPWNIADEIKIQNSKLRNKGTKFVTAIPKLIIS